MVARLVRNEKVGGSNPPSSTTGRHPIAGVGFCMLGRVGVAPVVVLLVAPLVFGAPAGPGCGAGPLCVPVGGGPPASRLRRELRGYRTKLKAVVTQNIDGLHQAAGSKRVLELHGNWTRLECTGCGARSTIDDFDEARAGRVPHCPSCSAVVRPDIVFYGEALDPATLEGAVLAIAGADMLIVGGTSLAVYPAAGLIDYYQGGRLVLMNVTPTPYDGRADLIIREPIGRVFAQIQGHV